MLLGAVGSAESRRQVQEVSEAFARADELGLVTVLWAYLRNPAFKHEGVDYHEAADRTGQANHPTCGRCCPTRGPLPSGGIGRVWIGTGIDVRY